MFPISTRNSPGAIAHLLTKTDPTHILVGPEKLWQDLAAASFKIMAENNVQPPRAVNMPIFEDLYMTRNEDVELLPPYKPAPSDLAFIMHSSGKEPLSVAHSGK